MDFVDGEIYKVALIKGLKATLKTLNRDELELINLTYKKTTYKALF